MAHVRLLTYPKKSHRKVVRLPEHSEKLAEFFGIMMGDGGINNPWQATISLNAEADAEYSKHVLQISKELFDIIPSIRKRKDSKTLVISLNSTTLIEYLVEQGLRQGNKLSQGLYIPDWIMRNREFRTACVRGLIDTDGCLYIHKHIVAGKSYQNIGLCFCSYSSKLISQVSKIFEEFGIIPHISGQGRNIYLYKASAVAKYLGLFGTSNFRISSKYEEFGGVG